MLVFLDVFGFGLIWHLCDWPWQSFLLIRIGFRKDKHYTIDELGNVSILIPNKMDPHDSRTEDELLQLTSDKSN